MKRIAQLQPLSKEHHLSLTLGQKAIHVSQKGDPEAIRMLCDKIIADYPSLWRVHFDIEEDSIFTPLEEKSSKLFNLCQQLRNEHKILDDYYQKMKSGDTSVLLAFGTLLKQHTRIEERQLFPLLEQILNNEELDVIFQTSEKYKD